jgi:hypothetical protein
MEDQKQENKMDVISVDVPLFIRLLEFAREDATDDMMLHDVAEKLIEMCADGEIMQMEQYDEIVGSKEDKAATSGMNAVEDKIEPMSEAEYRWLKIAGIITEDNQKIQLTPLYTERDSKGYRFYSANDGNVLYAEKNGVIYNVNSDLKVTGRASVAYEKDSEKFDLTGLVDDNATNNLDKGYYEKQAIDRTRDKFGL